MHLQYSPSDGVPWIGDTPEGRRIFHYCYRLYCTNERNGTGRGGNPQARPPEIGYFPKSLLLHLLQDEDMLTRVILYYESCMHACC